MQLGAAGYRAILHGQRSHNGVAILIRDLSRQHNLLSFSSGFSPEKLVSDANGFLVLKEIARGFPGDPIPEEARVLSVHLGKLRIINVYVVNGEDRNNDQFRIKQRWMEALGRWLRSLPELPPLLVVGDFNVAPDDRDVWDPVGLKGRIHCTDEERAWLRDLQGERLLDILRTITGDSGIYTWWPYQRGAFERNEGLRFDLALADRAVAKIAERVWVDLEERHPSANLEKPSDHAPIIVDFAEP